ncbi:MAG: magnesium transporter CorA family protein [Candidatus Binatus sp.]|uniref:magnesium transporter CorA family protein n=1 Tax=Candidatus Binatus sp. TaxID=2811406 RepID=UPI0027199A91|nr:magnesium transporter CorA family protein [Candidatus Binatus sp.]MDO8432320.1 magnesium transporter CorA family protein [Candidatus Binatus sp.]
MLTLHSSTSQKEIIADLTAATMPDDAIWIDMLSPDAAETSFVERATGLHVPTLDELSEIESSSRLFSEAGALYLSTPIVFRADANDPRTTPVGFVLTRERLITVRFQALTALSTYVEHSAKATAASRTSTMIFVGLLDAIVDRMADVLELVAAALDSVAQRIFRNEVSTATSNHSPSREGASLREILRRIGRNADLTSKIRDSLLGIGRIAPYVMGAGADWIPAEASQRLRTIRRDVASLSDYDGHLNNKVQLLLDATLGLINIEQNNIIKVLTVVSVVGVPPTLVASIYGMNFKFIPEYGWSWGYPYGLALIALSAIVPLIWFKVRGWL